mmetsp:Transcript_44388/g.117318  ORF Transcript_44388/g.117318 Transcript_44388/m.117318 type:complete len:238 (+) Transcript_44388:35-748(+)
MHQGDHAPGLIVRSRIETGVLQGGPLAVWVPASLRLSLTVIAAYRGTTWTSSNQIRQWMAGGCGEVDSAVLVLSECVAEPMIRPDPCCEPGPQFPFDQLSQELQQRTASFLPVAERRSLACTGSTGRSCVELSDSSWRVVVIAVPRSHIDVMKVIRRLPESAAKNALLSPPSPLYVAKLFVFRDEGQGHSSVVFRPVDRMDSPPGELAITGPQELPNGMQYPYEIHLDPPVEAVTPN